MNIIFLETKQNLTWTSMQEILPQLEKLWAESCSRTKNKFQIICVDDSTPRQWSKVLLVADLIVVSAFNAKIASFLKITRDSFGLTTPWVFYLHNQATIGLWPLYEYGIGNLLHQRDTFIGTCSGDEVLIEKLYESCQFELLPFYSDSLMVKECNFKESIKKVIFIGRVSEQKNLHSLFVAIKLLKDKGHDFTLTLYGKEDHLGSPNMDIKSSQYLSSLQILSEKLNLDCSVSFAGFINRIELEEILQNEKVILCSPSVHSDENFGMALLMGLKYGQRIVATNWGGHQNYIKHAPEIVIGCNVYQNGDGPFIKVNELADCLLSASNLEGKVKINTSFFEKETVLKDVEAFIEKFNSYSQESAPLVKSELLKSVLRSRESLKVKYTQKVFQDYSDPLASIFFEAYGAISFSNSEVDEENLLPWVKEGELSKVEDPQKGVRFLKLKELKALGYTY